MNLETRILNCEIHGDTLFSIEKMTCGREKPRCKLCRIESTRTSRNRNKEKLINEFGGKCSRCGYSKYIGSLHFHHKNRNDKTCSVAMLIGSMTLAREEAKKCDLVCANCHYEIEYEIFIKNHTGL